MTINIKDNRILTKRFIDLFNGDVFMINGTVCIKTSGFKVDNGPIENFYNSIDINGNFCYFTPATSVNPIKKISLIIEE